MPNLTPEQVQKFKQRLQRRRRQLIQEIHAGRVDTGNKNFSDMTGDVRDAGDESLAIQLSDLNISAAEKQGAELRQVETAWPAPLPRYAPEPGGLSLTWPLGPPSPDGCIDRRHSEHSFGDMVDRFINDEGHKVCQSSRISG
jgi:hypothetical protein